MPLAGLTCLPFSLLAGGVGGRGRLVGLPRRQDCRASSSLLRRTQAFHGRLFYFLTISIAISSSVASIFLHIINASTWGNRKAGRLSHWRGARILPRRTPRGEGAFLQTVYRGPEFVAGILLFPFDVYCAPIEKYVQRLALVH